MASPEENEILSRVGPGTLMGNLLRRYWTPALLSAELPNPDDPPVRVRLLCEDLVAFRDTDGKVGLVAENCPHRGASLYFGRNEDCAIRCVYHGWAFDRDGNCTDMPSEPRPFADRIKLTAYPTHESGGIVWTYMGPKETMTVFRDFGTESLPNDGPGYKCYTECNWLQSMEGNIDSPHLSYLHQWNAIEEIPEDDSDRPGCPTNALSERISRFDRTAEVEVEEEWYGFRYAGIRRTPNGFRDARVTAFAIPYMAVTGNLLAQSWVVPIDDDTCWRYIVRTPPTPYQRLAGLGRNDLPNYPYRDRGGALPTGIRRRLYTKENDYLIDRDAQRTTTFSGVEDFVSQDLMVTESMGPNYDRTREHLGSLDKGIVAVRQTLIAAAKRVAEGGEAPATGDLDYRSITAIERVLAPGEDWRTVSTEMEDDSLVGD